MLFVSSSIAALGSLIAFATFANAQSSTSPFYAANPAPTPAFLRPGQPDFLPLEHIYSLINYSTVATRDLAGEVGQDMIRRTKVEFGGVEERSELEERSKKSKNRKTRVQLAIAATCVDTGANDTHISSLFFYGGVGTTVYLCPNANITITAPIFFSAASQTLATQGYPTDNSRAMITVTGASQSVAIFGAVGGGNNIAVRNVQIDGNREGLGLIVGGQALMEMGGDNTGQVIDSVHAFEPRGWSCLHAIEGTNLDCSGMKITNNEIGPSGHAPSGTLQFRRRDNTGSYAAGQWADGISVACKGSTITGNVVTDATDGAIVLFGAPGTLVSGNTIQSVNRQLLGGVNMVDWAPFSGSFEGTVVTGNTIWARGNFIKVGIPMGGMVWGVDNRTASRTFGGTVTGNTFLADTGYFGYAIGSTGHANAVVEGNDATGAKFGGVDSPACFTQQFPLPTPQAFVRDPNTTPGSTWQDGFYSLATLVLLICKGPNPAS
ncbi:hypothetical protein P7C70_g1699, partial [Phenoliferia sp. Uapishka_3]